MPSHAKTLGILKPLGGGDPVPLTKEEMVVGRRPTTDVRLDFEKVSGKHCVLRMHRGVWHVRDLNSTNGTTVNGQRLSHEVGILPDDELGIAGFLFHIDYDPVAPSQVAMANQVLEEEISDVRRQHSLMELAGLENPDRPSRGKSRPEPSAAPAARRPDVAPARERNAPRSTHSTVEEEDGPIVERDHAPKVEATDDDFFKMIQGDIPEDTPGKSRSSYKR